MKQWLSTAITLQQKRRGEGERLRSEKIIPLFHKGRVLPKTVNCCSTKQKENRLWSTNAKFTT